MVKRTSVTCSGGDSCEPSGTNQHGMPIGLAGTPTSKNWFFSLQVFENSGARKIFTTAGGAVAYDAARLKEADLADVNAADAAVAVGTTPTWGDPGGKGWKYFFNHGSPNTPDVIKVGGADHKIYRADERNASVSAIEGGCTFWNTMQSAIPTAGLVTGDPEGCQNNSSPCKAGKAQVSYLYGASPGTGANCLIIDGVSKRSNMSESLVPPNIGKLVAYVSSGQVSFGLTSVRIPQGGSNVSLGEAQDLSSQMGWRPITKEEHMCRHAPKGTPPDPNLCK
jgi:type IV pilus assembly protein PilY1